MESFNNILWRDIEHITNLFLCGILAFKPIHMYISLIQTTISFRGIYCYSCAPAGNRTPVINIDIVFFKFYVAVCRFVTQIYNNKLELQNVFLHIFYKMCFY